MSRMSSVLAILLLCGLYCVGCSPVSELRTRLNEVERRMTDDTFAIRKDIQVILEKLNGMPNDKLQAVSHREEHAIPKKKVDVFPNVVRETLKAEKEHVGNARLLDVKEEVEHNSNELDEMKTLIKKRKRESKVLRRFKKEFIQKYDEMKSTILNDSKKIEELQSQVNNQAKTIRIMEGIINLNFGEIRKNLYTYLCSNNYLLRYGTSCYYFGPEELTWHDAKTKCASFGAYLAEMNSDAENDFILAYAEELSVSYSMWIGGTDEITEGSWIWSSSGTEVNSTMFKHPEPNGGTDENCLELRVYSDWNDHKCDGKRSYLCERPCTYLE